MVKLEYTIIRTNANDLFRKHHADAGLDISYCPSWDEPNYGLKLPTDFKPGVSVRTRTQIRLDEKTNKPISMVRGLVTLKPLASALFPTGIKLNFPEGYVVKVCERGSMGFKGLIVGSCVIDSGYTGEVFVDIHNVSSRIQTIEPGQRIAQILMLPIVSIDPEYISQVKYNNAIKKSSSNRGEGKLGSTGK